MRYFLSFFMLSLIFAGCSPNNVKTDEEIGKFFKEAGVEGCFAIMNNANGEFTVHNLKRYRDSAFLPTNTFDIVNSLVGLQTGKIVNDSMVIKRDSLVWKNTYRSTPCDADLTMSQAFRLDCSNYFSEVARRIGKDTMQFWLDSIAYGNKRISVIDSFWLDDSLKIKPDEQLGLVKRLYFNQLPFYKLTQEIVKKNMLAEDSLNYKLSYKTGTGIRKNGSQISWIAGWIEENRHPYFFVLNFETGDKNADQRSVGLGLLKKTLRHLGFFEGKM